MPKKIALLIGNSEYTDSKLSHLNTPQADVNRVAGVLRNPEIGNFTEVTILLNRRADTVRRQIARLFVDRQRDDLLLLYFSGHGVKDDDGHLHLAIYDTEHKFLDATAIPASYVTRHMDRSRSRRQVLILDCCHSGAFERGLKGTLGESIGAETAFEGTGYGRYVLTASDAMQYAWEGDRVIGKAETSVFTHHLIEGLQTGKADLDSDGLITIDEIFNYIYEKIVASTSKQTPCKWTYREQGSIAIARNPTPFIKQKKQANTATKLENASALRHSLIVRPPIAGFRVQYHLFKVLVYSDNAFSSSFFVDRRYEITEAGHKIGNYGVSSILAPSSSTSSNVVHLGLQVWLYDANSRETAAINLGFPRAYSSPAYKQKLTSQAESVRPKIGSLYYRETNSLLMQITVLNFETEWRSLFQFNPRSVIARFLKEEQTETERYKGIDLQIRVWRKSQVVLA